MSIENKINFIVEYLSGFIKDDESEIKKDVMDWNKNEIEMAYYNLLDNEGRGYI